MYLLCCFKQVNMNKRKRTDMQPERRSNLKVTVAKDASNAKKIAVRMRNVIAIPETFRELPAESFLIGTSAHQTQCQIGFVILGPLRHA